MARPSAGKPMSAASKADLAAAALDAFLRDRLTPVVRAVPVAQPVFVEAEGAASGQTEPKPLRPPRAAGAAAVLPSASGAPLRLPHCDWLHHQLVVAGPAAAVEAFGRAAAGAGTIPWQLDFDSLEEDWFHLLARPSGRELSLTGARVLAARLRAAVERRHALAVARVGHSRACPFDLHALVPVPADILRLGPDHAGALAWLWQHWGTTEALRHVAPQRPGQPAAVGPAADGPVEAAAGALRLSFWSADWTPWRAVERIRADWPVLRVDVQPDYAAG